ncbi:MAG: 2-C-methyl-D-erythritol 2,4-cyclodiphosphate synthase [Bacilli bacterium]|nr:2-C-methyl-D-erythritol 2,4-cyclodiphosphate synthase [Bacilli bacterium]
MERIGFATDIHRLVEGRRLILGGVEIPFEKGLLGHSDADVVMHAVAESILGALALGDLGTHFPNSDPKYKDMSSSYFVEKAVEFMNKYGYIVNNVDVTIVAEKPNLSKYIVTMRGNIAKLLNVGLLNVSVKACTNEGLDAVGRGEAIQAYASIILRKKDF